MRIDFTKMHGTEDDFVVFHAPVPASLLTPERLRSLAERRTGIGFNVALLLEPPRRPDCTAYYRTFNADGHEVAQCGDGAHCIAWLLRHRGILYEDVITLESRAGLVQARLAREGIGGVKISFEGYIEI